MVGDGRNQAECRGDGVRHVTAGGQPQDLSLIHTALERPRDREAGEDRVDRCSADGQPSAVGREHCGGDHHQRPGERQERGRETASRAPEHGGDGLGEGSGVGEVGERPGRPVGALRLAGQRPQQPARRGVAGGQGAADEEGVEDDPGRGHGGEHGDHGPSFADGQHYHPAQPDRPADAVELVGERGGGARVGHRVVVGLVEREVDDMAAGLEHHRAEREDPHVVATTGGAEGEARVVGVLLGPVEGGVEPGAHRRVLERVAGELPVGAVQDEGEEEQHSGRDVTAAGAGRRAAGRDQRGDQRGGGDLVRGEAPACAPAGDVTGVRADEVRGEEAVVGLHRAAQPYGLVVDGGHGGPRGVAFLGRGGHRGRE